MLDNEIETLTAVVCVNKDWIGGPNNRPHLISTYKIISSFEPSFNLGDIIVEWQHFDESILEFWKYLDNINNGKNSIYYFINVNNDLIINDDVYFKDETIIPNNTQKFNHRIYYKYSDASYTIGYIFNEFIHDNVKLETNKIFEAYLLFKEKYRKTRSNL